MKSFPNPLTPSEEKEYIQKYTEGDLQAKHILIERNLRLVAHVIKKYQYVDEDPEDLISIGTIGLKMRYGLYGGEEYTQREVAKQLGISRSYVSRIEKSAVEKLRVFFCSS